MTKILPCLSEHVVDVRNFYGGSQRIVRFANGFGLSVVRHMYSYGYDQGKFEIGLIKFGLDCPADGFRLVYNHTFQDVKGYLSEDDVEEWCKTVSRFPADMPCSTSMAEWRDSEECDSDGDV